MASLLLSAMLGELVVRAAFGPPVRWVYPQERYQTDPRLGYRLRPNQVAFTHDKPVRINSIGIRDGDYVRSRPANACRVLAIGDSQTFGVGISLEDTWPKQLQRELSRAASGASWEVINGGIPATNTWQHELILPELLDLLDPDLVILAFYVNDVAGKPGTLPFISGMDEPELPRRAIYTLKRSALLTSLWEARSKLRALFGRPSADSVFEQDVLLGISDREVEEGWTRVERSLASMRAAALERHSSIAVIVIPRRDQVSGAIDGSPYVERIAGIAAAEGIPSFDLLPPLRTAYTEFGDGLFVAWDGHDSAQANRAIASAIAPNLWKLFGAPAKRRAACQAPE